MFGIDQNAEIDIVISGVGLRFLKKSAVCDINAHRYLFFRIIIRNIGIDQTVRISGECLFGKKFIEAAEISVFRILVKSIRIRNHHIHLLGGNLSGKFLEIRHRIGICRILTQGEVGFQCGAVVFRINLRVFIKTGHVFFRIHIGITVDKYSIQCIVFCRRNGVDQISEENSHKDGNKRCDPVILPEILKFFFQALAFHFFMLLSDFIHDGIARCHNFLFLPRKAAVYFLTMIDGR